MHENEPYFLLQVFKAMTKLDTNYLRQKLLLAVDGILEEKEKLPASAVEDEEEELPAAIEIKRFVANEKRATATNTSTSKNFMRPPITPATTTANAATFASKTQLPVPSIFDSAVHNVMRAFKVR